MAQAHFDRNLKPGDARAALERIAASKPFRESRFSGAPYDDEPILRTGGELRASSAIKTTADLRKERARWSGGFAPTGADRPVASERPAQPTPIQQPSRQTGVIRTTASQREASQRWSGSFQTRPRVYGDEAIPPREGGAAGTRDARPGGVGTREARLGDGAGAARAWDARLDGALPRDARPGSAAAQAGSAGTARRGQGGTGMAGGTVPGERDVPAPARQSRAYRMIHDLAQRDDLRYAPASKVFYEQAKLMAEVESQADASVKFQSYFPTYQAMSDRQLNAYLAWRTAARKGQIAAPTPSFAFVYVYELLMGIGCEPGLPAFEALRSFWDLWRESVADQPRLLDFYLRSWLSDYVVYHGLPTALFEELRAGGAASKSDVADVYAAVPVLRASERLALEGGHLEGDAARQTFEALCRAASFRLSGSKFYKDYPDQTVQVTCRVFERMALHCAKRRKVGFVEGLFGQEARRPHTMFYGAVFHEAQPHRDATYRVSESESFVCRDNAWRHKLPCTEDARSSELGLMLHAIDHEMRRVWGYPKQVQAYGGAQFMKNFVDKEAVAAHEAWQAAQVPQVKIDRSLLRGIRSAAVKTRESLLVDEERGEGLGFGVQAAGDARAEARKAAPVPREAAQVPGAAPARGGAGPAGSRDDAALAASPATRPATAPASEAGLAPGASRTPASAPVVPAPAEAPCGLTASELAFVRALLDGDEAAARQAVGAGMLSLMVDAVNEKLFDELGDAAVEFAGEVPQLVEDYRPDIEALL